MSETNPYAPPKVAEPESTSLRYWQCYGARVMARNGAMLPKVDLETGGSEGEMTAVARTYQVAGAGRFMRVVLLIGVYMIARNFLQITGPWLLWGVIGGSVVLNWLIRIRGTTGGMITVWEFREAAREHRRKLRQRWRNRLLMLSLSLMILTSLPAQITNQMGFPGLMFFFSGFGLLVVYTGWAFIDRPKTRSESGPAGWLRIRNVDPEAMVKLRLLEAEELKVNATFENSGRRKIHTTYYHQYPLRSLLGEKRLNPFTVFLIATMKLLRSKRLERESFDFTEAKEILEDQTHQNLREKIGSWRLAHPDWSVLLIERLSSPAGDLMVDTVILVSSDLAHTLSFHHSWLEQKSAAGNTEFAFLTWVANQRLICTTHMHLLPIHRPNVDTTRVRGSEEVVFSAHLRRCAGMVVDAAGNLDEVRERFHQEKAQLADLLESAGLRGPSREAES
ncbi:MAG: hypothetical protein ABI600_04445 [Luteolibacter sp.]